MSSKYIQEEFSDIIDDIFDKKTGRRSFLKGMAGLAAAGSSLTLAGCSNNSPFSEENILRLKEYFKGNFTLMSQEDKNATIKRLERLAKIKDGLDLKISSKGPIPNVLFGFALNVSRCEGFMDCVQACVDENNIDRKTKTQCIRVFEIEHGEMNVQSGNGKYFHEVPVDNHFYMGVQCFQCENAPCIKACPTKATWREDDGIVVVDYNWCIGCRYCQAACPYWGRRFNWNDPYIPAEELTRKQHYLGNRIRPKGTMEKCTFCIQRTRTGRLPACVEICPTGSRVFGNLLDPKSEIRFVLENKKVFRMKEDLGTDPKFWYFVD